MKHRSKLMVFFLFVLSGYGVDIFSYTYTISNMTGKEVKIGLHYLLGTLTNKNEFIGSYNTRKFFFGGWEAGLCLTKIMVSIKKLGKWQKEKEAEIGIVKNEDRFNELREDGLIGELLAEGITLLGLNMCQSRHFVLVRDRMSRQIYAVTTIDI